MYDEDDLLPLSAVAHVVFCERRAALHFLEGLWEDNLLTTEGSLLHDRVHDKTGTEVRGDMLIARGLRLRSLRLGLSGIADVVEFHRLESGDVGGVALPGHEGLWRPFPIEYKRGRLRHERSFEVQACAQAICLEEMLGGPVPTGALFYGKTARRLHLHFSVELRDQTERAADRVHDIIAGGVTPHARYERKCEQCSMMPLCLPKAAGSSRSARRYLMLATTSEGGPS